MYVFILFFINDITISLLETINVILNEDQNDMKKGKFKSYISIGVELSAFILFNKI